MSFKYRTIRQCVNEIKQADPETAISEWFVRSLCKSGKVKYLPNGTKSLVNFDSLIEFLRNGEVQ